MTIKWNDNMLHKSYFLRSCPLRKNFSVLSVQMTHSLSLNEIVSKKILLKASYNKYCSSGGLLFFRSMVLDLLSFQVDCKCFFVNFLVSPHVTGLNIA